MQIYHTTNITQYEAALRKILSDQKAAILDIEDQGDAMLVVPVSVKNNITTIYACLLYGNKWKTGDLDAVLTDELKFSGVVHKNIFRDKTVYNLYDPSFRIVPDAYREQLQKFTVCQTTRLAEHIASLVSDALKKHLLDNYPDLDAVHAAQKTHGWQNETEKDYYQANLLREAQELFLKGKDPVFDPNTGTSRYCTIPMCIQYNQSIADSTTNEFVRQELEFYLAGKDYYVTNLEFCLRQLESFYNLQDKVNELRQNTSPEHQIFLSIQENLLSFLELHPNIKNMKITINGKDSMVGPYIKRNYKDFTIENKPVIIQYEAKKFLSDYQNQQCFRSWNLTYIEPKLRNRYNNRLENYIEQFLPSDIARIESGKTIIYRK